MTNSKSSELPIDTWLEELISLAESIDPVIAMTPDDDHLPDACGTADVADIKALKASAKRPSQLEMNDELVMVCDYLTNTKRTIRLVAFGKPWLQVGLKWIPTMTEWRHFFMTCCK